MSDMNSARPRLSINLAALAQNALILKERAPHSELCPVIKADAYGLGAVRIAHSLICRADITTFFVAYPEEAAAILTLTVTPENLVIYVLNGPTPSDGEVFKNPRIIPVLNSQHQADIWQKINNGPFAIAIDIGMNRLGFSLSEALAVIGNASPEKIRHVMMHLSHSGNRSAAENAQQFDQYTKIKTTLKGILPDVPSSLFASGGLTLDHPIAQEAVRPGIALFGGSASGDPVDAFETVATLSAPILALRTVPKGASVGYDGLWVAPHETHLAILSIGYADGYLRALSNKGAVWLQGQMCPVVGAISMDLTTVDVSALKAPLIPGEHAELIGDNMRLDVVAKIASTIGYEVLTAIGTRVERHYF